jgi:N-acetylglucosamine kinase-like BadF-type ATPase
LRAAAHHADGRGAGTAITGHVLRELGVRSFMEVIPELYGRPHPAPAILAAVRAVGRAAAESDAIAVSIVQRGAHALARAASIVATELRLDDGPVYLAGGAFESLPSLERAVRGELLSILPRATVEPVREEPAMGAARLAMRLAWGV